MMVKWYVEGGGPRYIDKELENGINISEVATKVLLSMDYLVWITWYVRYCSRVKFETLFYAFEVLEIRKTYYMRSTGV